MDDNDIHSISCNTMILPGSGIGNIQHIKSFQRGKEMTNTSPKKRRTQKYRSVWEQFPEFKKWLRPVPMNRFKAACIACNKLMVSEVMVLRKHSVSKKHMQKLTEMTKVALRRIIKRSGAGWIGHNLEVSDKEEDTENISKKHSDAEICNSDDDDDDEDSEDAAENDDCLSNYDLDDISPSYNEKSENNENSSCNNENHANNGDDDVDGSNGDDDDDIDDNVDDYGEYDDDDDYDDGGGDDDYNSDDDDDICKNEVVVSQEVPFWKGCAVINGLITEIKSADYLGQYLIMMFYSEDFSKLCSNIINTISNRISEFRALNTEIVACSVDSCYAHQAWARISRADGGVAHLKIPLLSDPLHTITKSFGCYSKEKGCSFRGCFFIDTKGILRSAVLSDDVVGHSCEEMLRTVNALRYADATGTLCSDNWQIEQNCTS